MTGGSLVGLEAFQRILAARFAGAWDSDLDRGQSAAVTRTPLRTNRMSRCESAKTI
jgi:hypothetical protein